MTESTTFGLHCSTNWLTSPSTSQMRAQSSLMTWIGRILNRSKPKPTKWPQEALIPMERWEAAKVRETLLSEDAIAFADEIGVHPAIVAGRLRHEAKNFRLLSHLIGKTGQVSQHFIK